MWLRLRWNQHIDHISSAINRMIVFFFLAEHAPVSSRPEGEGLQAHDMPQSIILCQHLGPPPTQIHWQAWVHPAQPGQLVLLPNSLTDLVSMWCPWQPWSRTKDGNLCQRGNSSEGWPLSTRSSTTAWILDSTVLPPWPCTRSTGQGHQMPQQASPAIPARGWCLQVQLPSADSGQLEPAKGWNKPRRVHWGFLAETLLFKTVYSVFNQHRGPALLDGRTK